MRSRGLKARNPKWSFPMSETAFLLIFVVFPLSMFLAAMLWAASGGNR